MKKFIKFALLSICTVSFFTACNTTIGLARDMRVIGTELEKKAEASYHGSSGGDQSGAPIY